MFCCMLPVILAFIGLCVDGSIVIYQKINLELTTEAAARGAIHSLDLELWGSERKIVLNHDRALKMVKEIVNSNMPSATVVKLEILSNSPEQCSIETAATVQTYFLKMFDVNTIEIKANAGSTGYDPNKTSR